jgi:hypothetical protein
MIKKLLQLKKLKLVYVLGKDREEAADLIFRLTRDGSVAKIEQPLLGFKKILMFPGKIFILSDNNFKLEKLKKFFSLFCEVIVLVNSDSIEREKEIVSLLGKDNTLLINDDCKERISAKRMRFLSYGFNKEANFYISDLSINQKTNFKLNYEGSTIPVWIEEKINKDDILKVSSVLGVGVILGFNFINLAQKIKKLYNN